MNSQERKKLNLEHKRLKYYMAELKRDDVSQLEIFNLTIKIMAVFYSYLHLISEAIEYYLQYEQS